MKKEMFNIPMTTHAMKTEPHTHQDQNKILRDISTQASATY